MIDSALQGVDSPSVKVFIDRSEMMGWEPQAARDDFKVGIKHGQ